ncbi:MAG TPA: peptidoglycan DD-metalloendopeptidase family protein [Gammaproteobacteria bacterium]
MTARALPALCVAVILGAAGLTACSSMGGESAPRAQAHVVQAGETLYTIAWRHGVDYRLLARWNNIRDPDFIVAGQRLRLTPPASSAAGAGGSRATSSTPASTSRSRPAPPVPPPPVLPPPQWQWPTQGPLVYRYGNKAEIASGIGIGGRQGQTVSAAAAGRVVYAGSGLAGYGQLVIIKHNDTYLSAYGHNGRLLVVQGQEVRRGDKIAEMGLGPKRQPRLHFEIRRNGAPVDPLPYIGSAG